MKTTAKPVHPVDWLRHAYREAMDGKPRKVEFPELTNPETGEPFVCYVWPETVAEQDRLQRAVAMGGLESVLQTVVVRCKDRDRNRIFQDGHMAMLRRECLAGTIVELCLRINRADPPATREPENVGKS